MYAILELGGKQYQVAPKEVIEVNKLDNKLKDKIKLDKVLLLADGKNVDIGQPYLKGVSVEAEVISQTQGKKVIAFKYRRRQDSHTKRGHRQKLTQLLIKKINKA